MHEKQEVKSGERGINITINSPFENFLQMYIVYKQGGCCKIALPYRKDITNPHGNFHGGAIASIIDTATVQALHSLWSHGPFLTVHLDIRYRTPSADREIIAEAKGIGIGSKAVREEYKSLIKRFGSEFKILFDALPEQVEQASSSELAEGVKRVRQEEVQIEPG